HATQQGLSDRHFGDAAGAADLVPFFDRLHLPEHRRADVVLLQVERQPVDVVRELQQLAGGDAVQAINPRDAVAGRQDRPGLPQLYLFVIALNLSFENFTDLSSTQFHFYPLVKKGSAFRNRSSVTSPASGVPQSFRRGSLIVGDTQNVSR